MKGRPKSLTRNSTTRVESFSRFLKPGALAQLRDSKIIALSHRLDLQTQISLYLLKLTADKSQSPSNSPSPVQFQTEDMSTANQTDYDGVPCFALRFGDRPRCMQRKKLVAVSPVFSDCEP